MTVLQSSQYFFLSFFLVLFENPFLVLGRTGSDGRSRSRDEEEDEQLKRRQLQEEHLSKVEGLYIACVIF